MIWAAGAGRVVGSDIVLVYGMKGGGCERGNFGGGLLKRKRRAVARLLFCAPPYGSTC